MDDWHLLRLFSANSVDGVVFFTREQAVADLQQPTLNFTMDGAPVSTIQTPITQLSAADQQFFGLPGPTFFYQMGSIFAPKYNQIKN